MDSYQKFEDAIVEYWEAQGTSSVRRPYWSDAGEPLLEIPLLEKLLTVAVRDGSSAQSGSLAKALDMWVAEELRAAGVADVPADAEPERRKNAARSFLALPAPTPTCSGRPIASRSMWGYPLG